MNTHAEQGFAEIDRRMHSVLRFVRRGNLTFDYDQNVARSRAVSLRHHDREADHTALVTPSLDPSVDATGTKSKDPKTRRAMQECHSLFPRPFHQGAGMFFAYTLNRSPAPQYSLPFPAHFMPQSPSVATAEPAANSSPQ